APSSARRRILSRGLIGKGKLERYPLLGSRDSGAVALAGRVFDQLDVSWSNGDLFTTRHFELAVAAQRNHVLAARRSMPVAHSTCRCTVQFGSRCRYHFEDVVTIAWGKLGLNLFGMRLPVRPSIEVRYDHTFVFLNPARLRDRNQRNHGDQRSRD